MQTTNIVAGFFWLMAAAVYITSVLVIRNRIGIYPRLKIVTVNLYAAAICLVNVLFLVAMLSSADFNVDKDSAIGYALPWNFVLSGAIGFYAFLRYMKYRPASKEEGKRLQELSKIR